MVGAVGRWDSVPLGTSKRQGRTCWVVPPKEEGIWGIYLLLLVASILQHVQPIPRAGWESVGGRKSSTSRGCECQGDRGRAPWALAYPEAKLVARAFVPRKRGRRESHTGKCIAWWHADCLVLLDVFLKSIGNHLISIPSICEEEGRRMSKGLQLLCTSGS